MSIVEMFCRKRTKREQEAFDMGYQVGKYDAVIHGRWIDYYSDSKVHIGCVVCSECGTERDIITQTGWNYCPICGCKMQPLITL